MVYNLGITVTKPDAMLHPNPSVPKEGQVPTKPSGEDYTLFSRLRAHLHVKAHPSFHNIFAFSFKLFSYLM